MDYAFFGLLAFLLIREVYSHRERREWAAERRLLMMRVQAPEVAARLDAREVEPERPSATPLPYDDDEAFHRYRTQIADN